MLLESIGAIADCPTPLRLSDVAIPEPDAHQILIRVRACGVCHTELDEIEGRTPPPTLPVILGHEVIGIVERLGPMVSQHNLGDRVGVGWIFHSDGTPVENLSPDFRATGRDANGGYAEFMAVHENYAFPVPETFADAQAAPLLCAGAIGYRALKLTALNNGQPLGLTGFGGSAHIVIQLARHLFPDSPVYVFARNPDEQDFALELGAAWAGHTTAEPPQSMAAIIDTTPAWTPIVEALKNLAPGGRLVVNAIRKQDGDKSALLNLDYSTHLWMEREIKTVANITANDIAEFLPIAAEIPITPHVQTYRLDKANQALVELKQGTIRGAKVLVIDQH